MLGSPTRTTPRLHLRAPQEADLEALFVIQRDPDAMQFTYCAPSIEATRSFLETRAARFAEDGYAPWTAVLAENGCVVGWGGLGKDPGEPRWGVEVAYFFAPTVWGRGLATELVRASLEHAFDDLALPEVFAFAKPANLASVRVLRKAGFERTGFFARLERDQFRVCRSLRSTGDGVPRR